MADLGASPGGAGGDRDGDARSPAAASPEDPTARHHRQLIELLNELRVGLPGVQVLFAFLLTVPFTQRYSRLDGIQRDIYFLAVLSTAMATACLIAPSSYHRLRWRQHDKAHMLETSNRLAIAGIGFRHIAVAKSNMSTDPPRRPGPGGIGGPGWQGWPDRRPAGATPRRRG